MGHVVGSLRSGPTGSTGIFFSPETGQILELKGLAGAARSPLPWGINDRDQIVGEQDGKAIFYSSPTAEPVELSKLLATDSGWRFITASGINDRGEIVGLGVNPSKAVSDYKLEPTAVPEPSTLAVFALVGSALAARSMVKRRRRVILAD